MQLNFKSILFFFCLSFLHITSYAQVSFIENKGQWEDAVSFKAEFQTGAFFLEKNGFTVVMHHPEDLNAFSEYMHGHSVNTKAIGLAQRKSPSNSSDKILLRSHAYKVRLVGASASANQIPENSLPTYNNYFIGNDKSKWKSECKIFQSVTYKNVYPNIDMHYYSDGEKLKYDFIIHPGGDINKIVIEYLGLDSISIKNKELVLKTSVGEVRELYPYTYQYTKNGRQTIDCKYVVNNNRVSFSLKKYDKNSTLVIDPTLIFSSFTGSTSDNWGYTATPGPDGSFYSGGITFGTGYKVSPGAYQILFGGGIDEDTNGPYDISIMKLSPNGSNRIYATYLGGAGNEQPHSMICDAAGNLSIAGRSNSSNYPGRLEGSGGLYDIVVTTLNATGTLLRGSVKIGGTGDDGVNIKPKYIKLDVPGRTDGAYETRRNYGDDARSEIMLDAQNNIILVSCTQSNRFPVTTNVFQSTFGGGTQDGVIMKFTPDLSVFVFSSFFGGSGSDACFVVSINPTNGNLYVAGATTSNNLPGDKAGVISSAYNGGECDGFVTIVSPNGASINKTTYLGTNGNDLVYGIQFDKFGFPYSMGTTTGNWPIANATFSNAGGKQFITKFQPDLSAYVYSTVFGTQSPIPNISPIAFLVDRCQNVYVTGWGGGINTTKQYPSAGTLGLPITADAIKRTTDGDDFYLFVLERNATKQLFGSFFGQTNGNVGDHVDGGTSRFDANGVIYQAMCANCSGPFNPGFFPTTPNAWARVNGSQACNQAAVKIEMNFSGVGASIKPLISGKFDTTGCVPLSITFTDTLAKGKSYIWSFGDGSADIVSASPSVSHVYNNIGRYRIRLISIDSTTCNISDTAYASIRVADNEAAINFTPTKLGDCKSLTYQFENFSTAAIPNFSDTSFIWDFGDGSPRVKAGLNTVTHTYAGNGTFNVKLILSDTTFCNAPDSVIQTVRSSELVTAQISTPLSGCVPYDAQFSNTSLGGLSFLWNFGDGSTSTEENPIHRYTSTGTFTVTLIAIDSTTCNMRDTTTTTIEVLPLPKADFSFSPTLPQENVPNQFTNTSTNATQYIWDFGDNTTSTLTNPRHQFIATGTYTVCLQAISAAGCIDTICKDVSAIVLPLLDVPSAFTPDRNDNNSVIRVVGFGISRISWKIYNRWGQLVFESNTTSSGWDGKFKGQLQPMDVYTYTLDAEFFDGKKVSKTGDITLIR